MDKRFIFLAAPLLASAFALSACGGSSSSDTNPPPIDANPGESSAFTLDNEWRVTLNNASNDALDHFRFCYDFANDVEGKDDECSNGIEWGLIVENEGIQPRFITNGGVTNENANGAAFGFFNWDALAKWKNATTDPDTGQDLSHLFVEDSATGVFSPSIDADSWFAYDLNGQHRIHPNFNVYLITQDASKAYSEATTFALQIIQYYGGNTGSESGQITIRWLDTEDPTSVKTATVDATHPTQWAYIELGDGTQVDAPAENNWDIAFRRTDVMLNGGDAGDGHRGGYIAQRVEGLYDSNNEPITSQFNNVSAAGTEQLLTNVGAYNTPSKAGDWVLGINNSALNPSHKSIGAWGDDVFYMDFGLFTYHPNGIQDASGATTTPKHGLAPNLNDTPDGKKPENAALLRSGDGESYARFHVADIQYSNKLDQNGNEEVDSEGRPLPDTYGAQTWTFHFDVQTH